MNHSPPKDHPYTTKVLLLVGAFVFLYASVLTKLGLDWWSDENYSHGLLVPFVIGLIIWRERDWFKQAAGDGAYRLGGAICVCALLLLLMGVGVGVVSGMLGIGGGIILVPGLMLLFGFPTKRIKTE